MLIWKKQVQKTLTIGILSFISIFNIQQIQVFAQDSAKAKSDISQKQQLELGDLISDIKIENKDKIYMGYESADLSLVVNDEDINEIKIASSTLRRVEDTNVFKGRVYVGAREEEYTYSPQTIVACYLNGEEIIFNREASNEYIFKQFDFDVKMDSIKQFKIENEGDLHVGDKIEISLKLDLEYSSGLTLKYDSNWDGPGVGRNDHEIYIKYNKDTGLYEGNKIIAKQHCLGKHELKDAYIDGYNDQGMYYRHDLYIDKNSFKEASFTIKEYKELLNNIKIVDKENIETNKEFILRAEVDNPEKVDHIVVKYDARSYGGSEIEYKLEKKEGNIYESICKVPYNRKIYKFDSIEIHRTHGSIEVRKEIPFGSNIRMDDDLKEAHWVQKDSKWYYFDENGEMVKRWKKINETWYYFKKDGSMETGWGYIDDKWYYFRNSGAMAIGWEKIDETWYYLRGSGAMSTGWEKVNGTWYYLRDSGKMAIGWEKINGTWYYLRSNGAMSIGWEKIDGKWYYLKSNGAMSTGWQKIDGKWYYMYGSGIMATNTVIDGWRINSSGVGTKK